MKNQDMKVTELLANKKELGSEIARIRKAIWMINAQKDPASSAKRYDNVVSLFLSDGQERVTIDGKHLKPALEAQLSEFEAELEPINKKLDAIELMLSI